MIASIAGDARAELAHPFPSGVAAEPPDPGAALAAAERRMAAAAGHSVRCDREGFLTGLRGAEIVAAAEQAPASPASSRPGASGPCPRTRGSRCASSPTSP